MSKKTEEYIVLANRTADSLSQRWEHWAEFLITASHLYKYSFPEQLMIYAQRPDATACAEYDIWVSRMNRYVRRGSKGIVLLDESRGYPRPRYVFDISDTGVRVNSRNPDLWRLDDELKQPVAEMLASQYGVQHEVFEQQLVNTAGKLLDAYWENNHDDIIGILDGSYLMSYDEATREVQFKSAAIMGTTYMLLERCGFEPVDKFDEKDFQAVYDFTTPASVYALGTAVSDCSRDILRSIECTVKATIRRRNAERSQYEHDQQIELHESGRLSAPEPDPAAVRDASGQVRQDAPDVPDAGASDEVHRDAPERDAVPTPERGAANGGAVAVADGADAVPGQGDKPNDVGGPHERAEESDRGEYSGGADLQLSFLDAAIPTEAEQIEIIDRAENEKSSSAFSLSQAEIENELRQHGTGFMDGKKRVIELYQTQPDRKLRAKALAKEFGTGGNSHDYLDGSSGFVTHDWRGLQFEHYPDHEKTLLRWSQVEQYIDLMIQSDRYLTDNEKELCAAVQEAERQLPMLDDDSAAEYSALKALYRNTLVGFELGGFYLFYGEDAHTVTRLLNNRLLTQENALGRVDVSVFVSERWASEAKKLWAEGNSVYLAGLNENDPHHHQTKFLREEDYLPLGTRIQLDGRESIVQHVNSVLHSVTL